MKPPQAPPPFAMLQRKQGTSPERLVQLLASSTPTPGGRYYHWDKLRHLTPPAGLSTEEWWYGVKIARNIMKRKLPLLDLRGEPFSYSIPDEVERLIHAVDRQAAGRIAMPSPITNTDSRDQYLVDSLIEEAITSSQLEGAATNRRVAEEMIRQGRAPATGDEKMIANNFVAMRHIRTLRDREVTIDRLLELHRMLTEETLDDPTAAGRLRREGETIEVVDRETGITVHRPPPAANLETRLEKLCAFANRGADAMPFVHPVVNAILLHFWLAYEHPFVDGNGRTARALFYWQMARQDYWLIEFVSISAVLKKARARYSRSFLYTETDDNDFTYFLLSQLDFLRTAIDQLHRHLATKMNELAATEKLLRQSDGYNYRQRALLSHALRKPHSAYTVEEHANSHQVVYETARSDLLALEKRRLLTKTKSGKTYFFRPVDRLRERLMKA